MDPNKPTSPTPPPPGATPVNPAPNLEPKVFDLSSINAVNKGGGGGGVFKKKPFIIGILSILLLVALIGAGSYFFIGQRVTQPPSAEECKNVQLVNVQATRGEGKTAALTGKAVNNCSTPVKLYLFKSWCTGVEENGICGDNQTKQEITIQPGGSYDFNVSQDVGDEGTCGSAQVDVMFTPDYNPNSGYPQEGAASYLEACAEEQVCKEVTISDGTQVAPGGRKRLEAILQDGSRATGVTWTVETNGTSKGALTSPTANPVLWTAPAALSADQTWTFNATIEGQSCVATVNFSTTVTITPTPTPTPTPTTTPTATPTVTTTPTPTTTPTTYRTCENNACVTKTGAGSSSCSSNTDCQKTTHMACLNNACVQVNGAGADSCTSDASCQPAAVPPPIPESGNTALTLVGIVTGLAALGAALFLAL